MRTRSASRARLIIDADAVIEKRVERLSRRPVEEIRADLNIVFCPGCRRDTIPLRNGCCGWCDRQLVKDAA